MLAVILSLFAAAACTDRARDAESVAMPARGPEFTSNAVVVAWSQVAFDAAVTHDGFEDFAVNLRGIAMMRLAMHDALNSILPNYERYALGATLEPRAHPTAAVAQAARNVLVNTYPAQQAAVDSELTKFLAAVPDGEGKDRGIQLGKDAAAAIISERTGDGWDVVGSYMPKSHPRAGDYQFVPPFDFVFRPAFGDAKPFGIEKASEFRGAPPPDLPSSDYAKAYKEVKAVGVANGSSRSEDQSHAARWWYEFAEIGWNRVANLLARQNDLELYSAARTFALVNMGLADAYVAIWDAKRFYDRWRPYTAIRAGDTDASEVTVPDPAWESFCVTPPTWEYPSAHAMQSAAAAEMLVSTLGTDSVSFTATSTTAPPERPERSFTSLRAAAAEAADSRVMCGIHFRYATDVGLEHGRALAESILARHLRAERRGAVTTMESFDTVVVGGGQAGLAAGYYLAKRNLPFVILDASRRIGDAWRNRWDSLLLFTAARISGLPGWPFQGRGDWEFPNKDETADYIEGYAQKFRLPVQSGVTVDRVAKDGRRYVVSAGDRRLVADNVVVATGAFQNPKIPPFATELDRGILQFHSSAYRNPAQLRSGDVLVVGAGNSGCELAMELCRAGHKTWLSGRVTGEETPFVLGSRLDKLITPAFFYVASRLLTTKSPAGRKLRDKSLTMGWPLVRVRDKAITAAGIERLPRTVSVKDGAPVLEDGRVMEVPNIIWATGYKEDFGWIRLPLLGADGRLAHERGVVASQPGLYFIGNLYLYSPTSALLGGVGRDAEYIVNHLASRPKSASAFSKAIQGTSEELTSNGLPLSSTPPVNSNVAAPSAPRPPKI